MRNLFWEYYRPLDKDFSRLWQECIFVFDTNVLLNFYRYTSTTRDELLRIIESLQDRVWLPHQVGLEFSRNRIFVILEQNKIFDLINSFDIFVQEDVEKKILQPYGNRGHFFADLQKIRAILQQTKQALQEELRQARAQHPDPMEHDQLLEHIDTIFKGRIGSSYTDDKMAELSKEFKKRYEQKIPPGFKDGVKNNTNKNQQDQKKQEDQEGESNNPANIYGDVILWFQVIDYAKQEKRPIILVVDDRKEDWWHRMHGRRLGPRIELRQEMQKEAGVPFYIYDADNFIQKAPDYLKVQVSKETIEEVQEISRQEAKEQKERSALLTHIAAPFSPSNVVQDILRQAQLIPPNMMQDILRQNQLTHQIVNSLSDLSQLSRNHRLYQNLYRQIQPFSSESEQQQNDVENQEISQDSESYRRDQQEKSADDDALNDTSNE